MFKKINFNYFTSHQKEETQIIKVKIIVIKYEHVA